MINFNPVLTFNLESFLGKMNRTLKINQNLDPGQIPTKGYREPSGPQRQI